METTKDSTVRWVAVEDGFEVWDGPKFLGTIKENQVRKPRERRHRGTRKPVRS